MIELKNYLEKNNITAYKFAKDNDFVHASVLNWTNGKNKPKLEHYLKIIKIINNE